MSEMQSTKDSTTHGLQGSILAPETKEIRCNFCSRTSKDARVATLYNLVSIFPTKICEHCLQDELTKLTNAPTTGV